MHVHSMPLSISSPYIILQYILSHRHIVKQINNNNEMLTNILPIYVASAPLINHLWFLQKRYNKLNIIMLHAQTLSTHTFIYVHTFTCTCTHTHKHACMCTHKHTCMHVHTHTNTHACMCTHKHTHTCMHSLHTHTIANTHTYTHMHACMHAHTYKHTHINILGRCCLEDVAPHNAEDTEISNTPT